MITSFTLINNYFILYYLLFKYLKTKSNGNTTHKCIKYKSNVTPYSFSVNYNR